jgi:hypothetical protein
MIAHLLMSGDISPCVVIEWDHSRHSDHIFEYLDVGFDMIAYEGLFCGTKFHLLMIGVEFFDRVKLGSFLICVAREGIYESVYLAYFWDKVCLKISLICRGSNKKSTILEEKSPHTIFTHSRVTNIAITDIHRILRPESISNRESDFLIAHIEPRMMPEIVIIGDNNQTRDKKNSYCNQPRIGEKICQNTNGYRYKKYELERIDHGNNPVLMSLVEDFFLEIGCCHM